MHSTLPAHALLLVLAGRAADSITTAYGLSTAGVREQNPLVAHVVHSLGPIRGLLLANVLAVATLLVGVELCARLCRDLGVSDRGVQYLRAASYAAYASVSFAVAAHNVHVLAAA